MFWGLSGIRTDYCVFLHEVHCMNANRSERVCPLVLVFQIEKSWTEFNEIWYEILPMETSKKSYF